jgi:MFS family permease
VESSVVMYLQKVARRSVHFVQRQTQGFKLMLWRRTLHGLATGLSMQYNSIYAMRLGADLVQLGSLQSVGNAVGALAALTAGWFIDYHSLKSVFLLGTALLTASRVLYLVAPHWAWLFAAIILYYLGMRITCTSCTVTCATELPNEDRATGRGFCRTVASPVAIVTPLLAAWLISRFGGISVAGIRPLYAIQTVIFVGIFVLLMSQLSDDRVHPTPGDGDSILSGFVAVLRQGPDVLRLMCVVALMELPWTLTQPFVPVYAHEAKGANEFVLGGIAVASTLVPMLVSIPLGRLADRHGRKKLLFVIAPLAYAANLCLVLAPPSGVGASLLLLYGVLFGFNSISMGLVSSMAAEVMPQAQMGRWIGIISLFRSLLGIPAPIVGGLIWEHIGPEQVFFAAIGIDLFLRLPLLALTRETLHLSRE